MVARWPELVWMVGPPQQHEYGAKREVISCCASMRSQSLADRPAFTQTDPPPPSGLSHVFLKNPMRDACLALPVVAAAAAAGAAVAASTFALAVAAGGGRGGGAARASSSAVNSTSTVSHTCSDTSMARRKVALGHEAEGTGEGRR